LSAKDVLNTLNHLSSQSIINAVNLALPDASQIIVCGGGTRNVYLMHNLTQGFKHAKVLTSDQLGYGSQNIESMAFAWLAHELLNNRPANQPGVTGARQKVLSGTIFPV